MSISFEILIGKNNEKPKREKKGRSLIDFPENYVVLDIETTGLSPEYDSIIEVAIIKIIKGKCVETFSTLIKPEAVYLIDENDETDGYPQDFIVNEDGDKIYYVTSFISDLTGITNGMLKDAPSVKDIIPNIKLFLEDHIIIGHNVNFDINFLYDKILSLSGMAIENNFVDTMRISRRLLTQLSHHRLKDIAEYYEINVDGCHRALKDCEITNMCLSMLMNDAVAKHGSIETFFEVVNTRNKYTHQKQKAKDIQSLANEFDISHPLYKKRCVFTGTLEKMIRTEAMQIVVDHGGINEDNVSKKTNYLILGNHDYCSTIKNGKSTKQKKAEEYKLKGMEIEIFPENVFYDMINDH